MTDPRSICLLRTSAIGDVTHVVPLLRTLQQAWPQATLTWIVGKLERKLVGDIAGVEFITFEKSAGWAGMRAVHAELRGRRFDALLQMQVAMRANLLSLGIHADRRVGYDHDRAKDLHGMVINERIPPHRGEHVLDAIGSFCEPLGLQQTKIRWDIPIPDEAQAWAEQHLPGSTPTLLVSPTSSHALRNWRPERYAAVMDHAVSRGWRVVLIGGPSANERTMADAILAASRRQPLDLTGKDTLKKLQAMFTRAQLLLSPDSGPMHMANSAGMRVLGLHAASNPDRSGPYSDRRWCVNKYDAAARKYLGKPASQIPWGRKIEKPGVMDLIEVAEVIDRFEAAAHDMPLAWRAGET
ncbi:MAG: glycosyltransferase family 9 protein [Rhodanobacter sp.]